MKTMPRFIFICCVALVSLGLSGCSSPPRENAEAPVDSPLLSEVDSSQADGPVSSEQVYPLRESALTYSVEQGPSAGGTAQFTVRPTSQFQAQWMMRLGDGRSEFLRREADGSVVMTAAIDHKEKTVSLFSPPLVMMPPKLAAGEAFKSQSAIRVVNEKNRSNQRASGTAQRTIRFDSRQRLRLGAGEVDALRLTVDFKASLNVATATTRTTLWAGPEGGILALRVNENVKVLGGLSSKSRSGLWVLSEPK